MTSSDADASAYFPTIVFFQVCGEDELLDASDDPRVPVAISRVQRDIPENGSDLLFLSDPRIDPQSSTGIQRNATLLIHGNFAFMRHGLPKSRRLQCAGL